MDKDIITLKEHEALNIGSKELAYLGDSVYETFIRTALIKEGIRGIKDLNNASGRYSSGLAQSKIYEFLLENNVFNKNELQISNRGRNTKIKNYPKNISIGEYRMATAFECIFGYLYLIKDIDRIKYIIDIILKEYISLSE